VPKIPGIRQQDAVRVFEKLGFRIARQSGHIVMIRWQDTSGHSAAQSH
jgi:predicted RNA binding protein YcfA (HicA-like mRNA interferase family)